MADNHDMPENETAETTERNLRQKSFDRARAIGSSVTGYFRNVKKTAPLIVIGVAVVGFAGGSLLFSEQKDKTNTRIQYVQGPEYSVLEPTTPYQERAIKEYDEDRKATQSENGESYIPMTMGVPQEEIGAMPPPATNVPTPEELVNKVREIKDPITEQVRDPAEPEVTEPETTTTSGTQVAISEDDLNRIKKLFDNWNAQVTRQPQYHVVEYDVSDDDKMNGSGSGRNDGGNSSGSNTPDEQGELLATTGDIVYASLTFAYNSDLPSVPVSSVIHGGKLDGGVLMGQPQPVRSNVVIKYNTLTLDGKTYQIDAYAVGNDCDCLALEGEYDPRIISRVILPAAARFLTGFALPSLSGGTNVTVDGSTVISQRDDASTRDRVLSGVSSLTNGMFDAYMDILPKDGKTQIYRGVPHAIFFTDEVRADR